MTPNCVTRGHLVSLRSGKAKALRNGIKTQGILRLNKSFHPVVNRNSLLRREKGEGVEDKDETLTR